MLEFVEKILKTNIVETMIVLIVSFIVYKFIKGIMDTALKRKSNKGKIDRKKETYIKLFNNILKYIFILLAVLLILQINGVNVTSLIAGLGIVGIVVGLALQDALKDIIMGANILTDNFFVVGDVIKYNDIEGKVISIGLKTTKIRDINTNNIVSITNRNIEKIINVSEWLDIDIPVSYNDKIEKIENVLNQVVQEIQVYEHVKKCEYLGLNKFADSSVIYKLRIFCNPEYKPTINRFALRVVKVIFDKNKITIPYMQIDIHNK